MAQDLSTLEIKQFLVKTLDLENLTAEQIGDDTPLFGEGLGLDSIDAFELGIALKKAYGLKLDEGETSAIAQHFRTPATLTAFVASRRAAAL